MLKRTLKILVSVVILMVIGGCATTDKSANQMSQSEYCYKPVTPYGYYR